MTILVNGLPVLSLVDSVAEQNLISSELVEQLQINVSPLKHPLTVAALTEQMLTIITHKTSRIHFVVLGNH